jgi:lipopolysaccharide transport system permease protein
MIPFFGMYPSVNFWAAPAMVLLAMTASLGVGVWLSALNVKYRDFRYVIPFITQFWMFVSPVVYPASLVPEKWRLLYALNPLTGAIEGFRWAVLGSDVDPWPLVAVSSFSAALILMLGVIYFKNTERFFADLI